MAHEKFAQAIAREIPAPFIGRFLEAFHGSQVANANGNGCGNGCGAGCIDAMGFSFDRFGQSGVTRQEVESAHKDTQGLRTALDSVVSRSVK